MKTVRTFLQCGTSRGINLPLHKYLSDFIERTNHTNFEHDGAFNSELFLLYCLHRNFKSDMFLESGLAQGYSTKILLSLIGEAYVGIDNVSDCGASKITDNNFTFVHGDSNVLLEEVASRNSHKKISVFIDGPKGEKAIALKDRILKNNKNVDFVGVHDTSSHFGFDNLNNHDALRVFESSQNSEYNFKYYNILNKSTSGKKDIFNFKNHGVGNGNSLAHLPFGTSPVFNPKTYAEHYPTGPGIAIYSNHEINFEL